MSDIKPESVHTEFSRAFAARDIDGLLNLYEDDAKFIDMEGKEMQGKAAIKEALQGFLAAAGPDGVMTLETNYAYECAGLAMLSNSWLLKTTGPDGQAIEMAGKTVEVARKQPDGSWRMVLDNPAGAM